jgi:hypothetical protein
LIEEWTKLTGPVERKKARQHLRNHGVPVPYDAGVVTIGPETIKYLNLFAHKAVLALYFEHFRTPLPMSGGLSAYWKTKEDFAKDGIPPELLRIMPRGGSLQQGKWDTRETFEYRYDANIQDGLFGCLARLRTGLFVMGFAATDPSILCQSARKTDPLSASNIDPSVARVVTEGGRSPTGVTTRAAS